MKRTHLIRLVYIDKDGLRPTEEEIVLIDAESVEIAAREAMKKNLIVAGGRIVEKYDEHGNRVHE